MKRNLDLVRELLLAIEVSPESDVAPSLTEKGYTEEEIGFHTYLIGDAGLARVIDTTTMVDIVPQALPINLTWKGCEFLDAAREGKRWKKVKSAIGKIGTTSFDVIVDLLKQYAKQELGL